MIPATTAALFLSIALAGQPAPTGQQQPAAQAMQSPYFRQTQDAMSKLSWLAGRWEGEVDFHGPGGNQKINQTERIEMKVDGTVLLIEGTGRAIAGGKPGDVVFRALATLTWDPMKKAYSMRAYSAMGHTDPAVEVGENEMKWSFTAGPPGSQRHIRYHIRRDEAGRWHETGEMSADGGKTWMRTIEMTLTRVGDVEPNE